MQIKTLSFKNSKKLLTMGLILALSLSSTQIWTMGGGNSETTSGASIAAITAASAHASLAKIRYPNHEVIHNRFTELNHIIDLNQRRSWLTMLRTHLKADDCRRARQEPPILPITLKWQREITNTIRRIESEIDRIAIRAAGHVAHSQRKLGPSLPTLN